MLSRPPIPNPNDYGLDNQLGFVPPNPTELPSYYVPWAELASDLPQLLASRSLQKKVACLPLLTMDHLTSIAHWQRAYVLLGYLTQAYIWQDKARPSDTVPVSLGDPFVKVCEHLGMEAVLSYTGTCLWNWVPRTGNEISSSKQELNCFDEITSCVSFTGTRDEDAFNLVPVMVEAQAGRLVPLLLDAVAAARRDPSHDLTPALETCAATLDIMGETLSVLHQNCAPSSFFHEVRPMIGGSLGAEEKGLPRGVAFERTDGTRTVVRLAGASAAQSAFFQFLDHMLGVEHESKMLVDMRSYVPGKHREFLYAVEQLPSLRDIIEQQVASKEVQALLQVVISKLRQFRTKHVAIVTRYIVQPGAKASKGNAGAQQRGTAGSLPVPFLKKYRDETTFRGVT